MKSLFNLDTRDDAAFEALLQKTVDVMNREALADYLNVSRPSMSRELGRMKDEGVIDFYRSSFVVKDVEALKLMI